MTQSVFVPRAAAAVERGSAAHTARFATPVRAIGGRLLGFADRLVARLLGGLDGRMGNARSAAVGALPFPRPWYELGDEGGEVVAGARPAMPAPIARERVAMVPLAPSAGEERRARIAPVVEGAVAASAGESPSVSAARLGAVETSRVGEARGARASGAAIGETAAAIVAALGRTLAPVASGLPRALAPVRVDGVPARTFYGPLARIAWTDRWLGRLAARALDGEPAIERAATGPGYAFVAPVGERESAPLDAPGAGVGRASEHAREPSASASATAIALAATAQSPLTTVAAVGTRASSEARLRSISEGAPRTATGLSTTGPFAAATGRAAGERAESLSPLVERRLAAIEVALDASLAGAAAATEAGTTASALGRLRLDAFLERLAFARVAGAASARAIEPAAFDWVAPRPAEQAAARSPSSDVRGAFLDRSFAVSAVTLGGVPSVAASAGLPSVAAAIGARGRGPARFDPGATAVLAERAASSIGLRAAGVALDFVDPASQGGASLASTALARAGSRTLARDPASPSTMHGARTAIGTAGAAPIETASAPTIAAATSRLLDAERAESLWRKAADAAAASVLVAPAASTVAGAGAVGSAATRSIASAATVGARAGAPVEGRAIGAGARRLLGSWTWPRATAFAPRVGGWAPATARAAATGVQVAVEGGAGDGAAVAERVPLAPAWVGMAPSETPIVRAAFEGAAPETIGARARPDVGARGRGASLVPSVAARPAASRAESVAPWLRALTGGLVEEPGFAAIASGSRAPIAMPPVSASAAPAVSSAPTGEASARLVEALRAQQQHAADDRVTLADLTLVAVASATGQLAASQPDRGSAVATAAAGGATTRGASGPPPRPSDPEAERREIEELARQVLDEVHTLIEIARERSGGPWAW